MQIKMNSMQIVFLFDLNTCSDFLLISKEELNKKLLSIRLTCIRLLTDFYSKIPNFKWGCKFFDSSGSIMQTMCKFSFSDVSLESFETLENEICVRYERHKSLLQALEATQKTESSTDKRSQVELNSSCPVKILHFALTQILCEFQWESMDMWSPSARKFKDNSHFLGKRNFLFIFSDFKDRDDVLLNYFGLNSVPSKQKLISTLLPHALKESLFKKANIHLVFLNTNVDFEFNSTLSSNMLPLLSETLHSVQGCMIPLSVLSLPLYSMQFMNNTDKTLNRNEALTVSDFPCSFHSCLLPFSSLFYISLHHNFFFKDNNVLLKFCVIINKGVQIPIKVMPIGFKKESLNVKEKSSCFKGVSWSKFIVKSIVSMRVHSSAYEMLLCLPDYDKSEDSFLQLNKSLTLEGLNLLVECVTDCGVSVPGLLIPLSIKTAIISVLHPPKSNLLFKPDSKCLEDDTLKIQNVVTESIACKAQNSELKMFPIDANGFEDSSLKPFKMECLEVWFKPAAVSNLACYMQSKTKNCSKVKPFHKMLQEFARNSKNIRSKSSKKNLINISETNIKSAENREKTGDELPDNLSNSATGNIDKEELLLDLSYEELGSSVQKMYDSALEQSTNTITSVKRIVKLVINHYKKENSENLEEKVQRFFESNIIITAKRISEKYEMLDSEEDIKRKIKECQIQVLIILEIEDFKMCPHKTECVNSVISFLRLMIFNCGLVDLRNFIQDILFKNYGDHLYDILVEIGDELNISIFDEDESAQSPADTVSSEIMNEDELFSCALSSNISEKSTSSTNSRKDNGMEKKLLRRRSDISVTAACRQVILPRTSSKDKKKKAAVNKGIRCSPRIASRKKEAGHKPVSDKPRTVRRNLFPVSCQTPKKNKNKQPTTPKRSSSKAKFVAETPSHKQNYSALQRRKAITDNLTSSPKVIAESPQITKKVKEGANKELLEKLQKARLNIMMKHTKSLSQPTNCPSFTQYTPESKRRLSLKLFSKFLSSPTARMGIKKCTKRLFDQISPAKEDGSRNKKIKFSSVSEQASH